MLDIGVYKMLQLSYLPIFGPFSIFSENEDFSENPKSEIFAQKHNLLAPGALLQSPDAPPGPAQLIYDS